MVSSFIIVSVLLFVFKISNVAIDGQEPRSIIFLPTAFLLIIFFLILLHVFVIIAILIFLPDPIWTWTWFFGVRLKVFTWRSKTKTKKRPVTSTTRMTTKRAASLYHRKNIILFLLLFSACLAFKQIKAGTLSSLLLLNSKTILFSFFNLQSNNWHWIMQWNIIISLYTLWTLWDWRNIFTCFVILVCIRQISRLLTTLFHTWNAFSEHWKHDTITENLAWNVFRICGNVPSLPSLGLGGLPSTGLAAPPSTPAQVVQPPPSSGQQILPLEKFILILSWILSFVVGKYANDCFALTYITNCISPWLGAH